MKKLFTLLITAICCVFSACGGGDAQKETYKVSFVQEGQTTIIKEVNDGEVLTDVPDPIAEEGYEIVWDVSDFSKIKDDYTVNAVKTAKTFTITYNFERCEGYVLLEADYDEQNVTYNTAFTLLEPYAEGYFFRGWMLDGEDFSAGTYTLAKDIELVAKWEVNPDSPVYQSPIV